MADETHDLVWEDPPPARSSGGPHNTWARRLAPLVERPGEWARVAAGPSDSIRARRGDLSRGTRIPKPPGRWEFVTRVVGDGQSALYARYLGPDDEPGAVA